MAAQEENESPRNMYIPVLSCVSLLQLGINNDLQVLKITYSMEKESLFCILTLRFCHYFHSACPILLNKALFWNLQYIDQEPVQNVLFIHSLHSIIDSSTYKTISTVLCETHVVLPTESKFKFLL